MSKESNKVMNILETIVWIAVASMLAACGWQILDIAGAAGHTGISSIFNYNVRNYVVEKRGAMYFGHIALRALVSGYVLLKVLGKEDRLPRNVVLRTVLLMLILESIEFSAYLLEFVVLAVKQGILTAISIVQIPNVLHFGYLDTLDVVARFCQAFILANLWVFWTKMIQKLKEKRLQKERAEAERERRRLERVRQEKERRERTERERRKSEYHMFTIATSVPTKSRKKEE